MTEVTGDGHVVITLTNLMSARQLGYSDGRSGAPRDPLLHHVRSRHARAQYYSGYIRGQFGWPLYPYCTTCHDHHADGEHTRLAEKSGRIA